MKKKSLFSFLILCAVLASQSGCDPRAGGSGEGARQTDHADHTGHTHDDVEGQVQVAVAELQPTEGHEASGTVTFTRVEEGIRVVANLTGLGEPGRRGFHIHENGDCSAPDATSAGGHFDPTDMPHGSRDASERHAGDFGNIEVDEDGNAAADFVDAHISFEGENSIIGRAVIVHATEDDLETQPTGDAGARAACGVIQATEYSD